MKEVVIYEFQLKYIIDSIRKNQNFINDSPELDKSVKIAENALNGNHNIVVPEVKPIEKNYLQRVVAVQKAMIKPTPKREQNLKH
jgi:hypothetical protein